MAVVWPTTRVAVPPGVTFAGPPVAVGTTPVPVGSVAVKSAGVAKPCVAVVVCVSVAGTTGDEDGDAAGTVAASVVEAGERLGRAVNVCATAVLNNASDVAAESTVGPVGGVGVKSP